MNGQSVSPTERRAGSRGLMRSDVVGLPSGVARAVTA